MSCYPESKIQEYREAVQQLQGEYWAFVRKIKLLDPQCDVVPWTERGYSSRKRSADPGEIQNVMLCAGVFMFSVKHSGLSLDG